MEVFVESCCFTGYRPSKFPFPLDRNSPEYLKFEKRLFHTVYDLNRNGCKDFYCGMAMGFDLLAGEIVLTFKRMNRDIKLHAVIPFRGQGKKFTAEWHERYREVLENADEVICLSENYHGGCFQVRNKYMVDKSELVLTWFDGQKGGTANTVNYAKSRGIYVLNLYNDM